MIAALGSALSRWSRKLVPDPLVLALALTLLALFGGAVFLWASPTAAGPGGAIATVTSGWTTGMMDEKTLAFALKMGLILVTGHALALSPPVARAVRWIAARPDNARSATVLVAVVSCVAALIHWGLGAVVGALMARELARHARARGLRLHYPLLGAAAYSGFAVWHGGLTGSAPTLVAGEGHFAAHITGIVPMSATVFSAMNLAIIGAMIAVIALLMRALVPTDEASYVEFVPDTDAVPASDADTGADPDTDTRDREYFIDRLQASRLPGALIGTAGLTYIVHAVAVGRLDIQLDTLVLGFLFVSLAMQGSISSFVAAVTDGARGVGAILVQFPLYGGILGIMKAAGLIAWLSGGLAEMASSATFPALAFLSAGLLNLFIPSGGGQWIAQGDILLAAGDQLGVDPAMTVMAFSYGDAWTNMLQPFWALPLLGIMGLPARAIVGYTAVIFLAMGVLVPSALLLVQILG